MRGVLILFCINFCFWKSYKEYAILVQRIKKNKHDDCSYGGGDDDDGNKEFCILRKPSVSSEETLLENEVQYWKKQNMYLNLVCITELISTSLNSLKNKV